MTDPCRTCHGAGRYREDDPHSYRPGAYITRSCECQPNPPETRRSRDDDLAAYIATLNYCPWEAPRA